MKRSEYFRRWYERKKQDPAWMQKRREMSKAQYRKKVMKKRVAKVINWMEHAPYDGDGGFREIP